jgi:hypothetical protein
MDLAEFRPLGRCRETTFALAESAAIELPPRSMSNGACIELEFDAGIRAPGSGRTILYRPALY